MIIMTILTKKHIKHEKPNRFLSAIIDWLDCQIRWERLLRYGPK